MRVVHLISNLGIGGAEMALCLLVESTAKYNIQHTVVSFLPDGRLRSRLEQAGATVIELNGRRGIAGVMLLPQLARAVRPLKPDIVHAWMYHANTAATVLQRFGFVRCPLIWSIRQSADNLNLDAKFTQVLIRQGARWSSRPDVTVYNSGQGARSHEALGYAAERSAIISNGIDCDRFKPRAEARARLRAELGLPNDVMLVGRVARYSPMKDFQTLLKAFRRVLDREGAVRFVMVGTGVTSSNQELVDQCRIHGLLQNVHLMGPRLDIEAIYPGLDVLVSSSVANEGFPNVVAEGLASGTLVVATATGEEGLVRCGVPVVVEPGDHEAIAGGVLRMLGLSTEERAEIAGRGRAFVEANYSAATMAARHHELYLRLLPAKVEMPA